jgi:hypothetical protein
MCDAENEPKKRRETNCNNNGERMKDAILAVSAETA